MEKKNVTTKNKSFFEMIFSAVDTPILIMDQQCFVECNLAAITFFECNKEDIITHHPKEFSPENQPGGQTSEELSQYYISEALKGKPQVFDWRHKTKTGKELDAEVKLTSIELDGKKYCVATLSDVSEVLQNKTDLDVLRERLEDQKERMRQINETMFAKTQEIIQNQAELERNRIRFEAIYNGASDAIFLISNHKITDCNQAALDLYGCEKANFIGRNPLELTPETQADGERSDLLWDHYLKEIKKQAVVRFDWLQYNKSGEIFYAKYSLNKTIINRKSSIIAIVRDVTVERQQKIQLQHLNVELEEKQEELSQQNEELNAQSDELLKQREIVEKEKEKADQASKSKSLFLASMSHEIRTPLNGIIGMLNLLKETSLKAEQKEFVNVIDVSSEGLLSIINDILDYSKIEANQLSIEYLPIDLRKITKEVVHILEFKAEDKGLFLNMQIDENVPNFYRADAIRLKQILINYCNNAIKFTSKGGVGIKISLLKHFGDKAKLKFEVVDTGIGISKENQKKLFKEFTQVDNSISRKFGGTGLGLAISMRLARLMNGEVGLESEEGKGSIFWFTATLDTIAGMGSEDKVVNESMKEGLSILLVEDNLINQRVAVHTLEKNKHLVEIANNGLEGVEKFKAGDYDLILMDVQMPKMNGYEATLEIRKIEKESGRKPIKIIAMTANAMKGERERCIDLGMDDYISKPFKKEDLLRVL